MNILTAQFVEGSEVFKDNPLAWEAFSESDPDCSWGNNNRTLVTPDVILNALDNIDADEDDGTQDEIDTVRQRLEALPPDLYIDLEN